MKKHIDRGGAPKAAVQGAAGVRRRSAAFAALWAAAGLAWAAAPVAAPAAEVIPHKQTKPPGPPQSPAEAVKKMTVPEGFSVEVVACEPDLVNPVAMTFDERGRVWVTESFEYPRHSAGPGRDRVKVLEDVDGDGTMEKVTIFAEGLNIPSGIAVGHGGVWVANAPDLLFMQDTDGDGKADKQEVVVTGFGRADTHELPNSLTWGPDGWLYGINGVFNPSVIKHQGKEHRFTCALFRIHPKTREFQLFSEGTSNPWGVAWNNEGEAFISACVIDHLWHLTETGYYHRQGGPYPPFTWKIESIVKHKHQMAAYCGITWFDSEAYPAKYREKLYMGNIHGGCLNCDRVRPAGSTYFGEPEPDFLTANDVWFMPVVQKTGPDGCLYVLDWYDRYHCYQDANRDPAGIDRGHGRLYRVRYKDTPRRVGFDLAKSTDEQLVKLLASGNIYDRETAQRLLQERNSPDLVAKLGEVVFDEKIPKKTRLHALYSAVGGGKLPEAWHEKLLADPVAVFRAWGVRAAGNEGKVSDAVRDKVEGLKTDLAPEVRLQVVIALNKIQGSDPLPAMVEVAAAAGEDPLAPRIVWRNLQPKMDESADRFLTLVAARDLKNSKALAELMPRVVERLMAAPSTKPAVLVACFDLLSGPKGDVSQARRLLSLIAEKLQTRELSGAAAEGLKALLAPKLAAALKAGKASPLFVEAAFLATTWREASGVEAVRAVLVDGEQPTDQRLRALEALISADDAQLYDAVSKILAAPKASKPELRGGLLNTLGRTQGEQTAAVVLANYDQLEPDLQPRAVELLTQRTPWAKELVKAVAAGKIPPTALNANQIQRMQASKDEWLVKESRARFGTIRATRNPQREQLIAQIRRQFREKPGDPVAGAAVFQRVCSQCHVIHGQGQQVGPDITRNGRSSYDQLLSNVFDPSLVIGPAYQAWNIQTTDGRVLTGLLVEKNDRRTVLKVQGGKLETISADDVEESAISPLSLMPEGLEKQLQPKELFDLLAFLTLDKPPADPEAQAIAGSRGINPRDEIDPARFGEVLAELGPGMTLEAVGEKGLGLLAEHRGRTAVVRTHPISREKPCTIQLAADLPAGKKSKLKLSVAPDPKGDWRLVVLAAVDGQKDKEKLYDKIVNAQAASGGWLDVEVDLSKFAGKTVKLELQNQANDWAYEFGYWQRIEVVSE